VHHKFIVAVPADWKHIIPNLYNNKQTTSERGTVNYFTTTAQIGRKLLQNSSKHPFFPKKTGQKHRVAAKVIPK